MTFYRNFKQNENDEIVFYEIFRRHTSTDPRDASASWDDLIGTVDTVPEAEDVCQTLNNLAVVLIEKSNGYKQVWEDFEDICPYTDQPRKGKRSTGVWVDEFGFLEALEEYRKDYDPGFYTGDRPKYMYRAVRRAPQLKLEKVA